jgi:FlaA1/EpsC-like NDP-sugar epimerase
MLLCESSDILMFDMGRPVKIFNLAQDLLKNYAPESGLTIDIIGLRPGEKLYEELLCDGENVVPTENKHIMKSRHKQTITENFLQKYTELIKCEPLPISELKAKLKEIVPEYNI